ncbi:glycosyltransferase family 2 protein [Pedobacter sp. L105]|uniref:glycosyltransferase family 2 protein n=1 Tax=Pedobacter sp. L105 TaxID=1641871 RepID=UPI00131CCF81|nr:glycosyltransferase [Pedobacter sp. L105]
MAAEITEIDIIILSFAQTEELKQVTVNCLDSLIASEDPELIKSNIIVVESQKDLKPFQYNYGQTVYPDESFGYNRYMNIGISMTSAPYVCLCNNDLFFHPQWATEIVKVFKAYPDLSSASPMCTIHHAKLGVTPNMGLFAGHRERTEVSGWCLFFKRSMLSLIGHLDENFIFRHASHDYTHLLSSLNLNHFLVTSSVVDHLDHTTLNKQEPERWDELMYQQDTYYEKKWGYRLGRKWELI